MWRELREAVRGLGRAPGFAAAAVGTLALGIGATTAIFTLVEQVMLRPLPVERPGELWRVGDADACCYATGYKQGDWNLFSWEQWRELRAGTRGFEELAAFQVGEGNAELAVRRAGSPEAAKTANGEFVSGNFFRTFGVPAWRGRVFTDGDDRVGAPAVAVMSFHAWEGKFGADPGVVGGTYLINGHPFTVIGVAAPRFFGARVAAWGMPDLWLPLGDEPVIAGATSRLKNPALEWLDLIGRVQPGTNAKTLEAQVQVELNEWIESHTAEMSAQEQALEGKQTVHVTPGGAGVSLMKDDYKDALGLLLAASICVLLVACANVANLLLARGMKERGETALRAALGASRGRLVGKALAESVVLAVAGGAAGIAVAYAGAGLILRLAFTGENTWVPVSAAPSWTVLGFALAVSVATGVLFGIAPAWMSARADPIEALKGTQRTVGGGRHGLQKALVVAQAAVSVVLLSAAAMLGQSLRNLETRNFGFEPAGRYVVSIDPKISGLKVEQMVPLFREIGERLKAVPGVKMASPALFTPLSGGYWGRAIRVEGQAEPGPAEDMESAWTRVTPGFFETIGDRIVAGRAIGDEDRAGAQPVAVVNEAFARKFFGNENPVGRRFGPAPRKNAGTYEIVGVAADVRWFAERGAVTPMYFVPEAQEAAFAEAETESREVWSHFLYSIVIWAPGKRTGMEAAVRRAIAEADPNLVVYGVLPYSEVIRAGFAQANMIASLTGLFGMLGLVLAAVGVYGVTAYGVERRRSEIGVRMALGADRGSVVGMVVKGAFGQVGLGLALGIPAAVGAGKMMASRLYGVPPWDPAVLAGAAAVLGLAALAAAVIPARRAAGVDPVEALRAE
jgi:putative ABC transport system permease protein